MEKESKKKISYFYYIAFLIIYLEIVFKLITIRNCGFGDVLYTILFSMPIILVINMVVNLFKESVARSINVILSILITLYFLIQLVFFKLFSVPFSFATVGLAGNALGFTDIIIDAIKTYFFSILIFLVPLILYFIFRNKICYTRCKKKTVLKMMMVIIILVILIYIIMCIDKKEVYSLYNLYFKVNAPEKNIKNFGLLTATKLDVQRTIFGFEEDIINTEEETKKEEEVINIEYEDNIIDIDFETLKSSTNDKNLINIYNYIENSTPTKKNEYTGYFKGKNLIFILAEGFNNIAVDENLTPTLYKLSNSGFVFNNFYSPVFLSTTGGEFQATTGLIPTQGTLKLWKEEKPTIKYALGNSLGNLGYYASAYHNWTYNYYSRDITMGTLGFDTYMGLGNGLEQLMSRNWLPSDIDLVDVTADFYMEKEPFVTYYVTVSGHAPYVISQGNSIAYKNKEEVQDLPYSQMIKAYLATQIELDRALEKLIDMLEKKGKLDNTVIALVGDHYPYTIPVNEINQISSYERDDIIEVNRSNFILWNNEMKEVIEVEKVGSQIDVLPTLLNLFGVEYDSRLIIGKDILSDSTEGIAIFSNRSWVTNLGTYISTTGVFTPKEGAEIEEGYINKKNVEVANKFTMSNNFIKYNIYTKF